MKEFVSVGEAVDLIRKNALRISGTESLPLANAAGRVLAADARADSDLPPFDRSTVDGWAVADAGLKAWRAAAPVRAGDPAPPPLARDECASVMTGARVPPNAVRVIMSEDVEVSAGAVSLVGGSGNANIARRGEDLGKGDIVVPGGTILSPWAVGSLVASGSDRAEVARRIRIAYAVTGDELVPEGTPQGPAEVSGSTGSGGRIRDVNSSALAALISPVPLLEGRRLGIVPDTPEAVRGLLREFEESSGDILIVSGGAGRGERDFVLSSLEALGFGIVFYRVRVQPGKPCIFARKGAKLVFGLPGNPVATVHCFGLFVMEAVYALLGLERETVLLSCLMERDWERNDPDREAYIPVRLRNAGIETLCDPVRYNGSGHISAYVPTVFAAIVPEGTRRLARGDRVAVRQLWRAP
jgi:molybdopterin molybdotransferase